jgi:hypothetical protein
MMHGQVVSRLSAYLEGELSSREEAALESHLAECAPCSAELRALRRALELLHGLPTPELPSDIGGAVLAQLRAEQAQRPSFRVPWARIAPFALAAGIGAVAYLTPVAPPGGLQASQTRFADAAPAPVVPVAAQPARPPGKLGIGSGTGDVAGDGTPRRVAVSTYPVCLERFRTGKAAGADCAAWYAYLVSLASDDASRFLLEVRGLPKRHRSTLMEDLSQFAALSGSAPTVGTTLRTSRDPRMVRLAPRFERRSHPTLRQAAWDGR